MQQEGQAYADLLEKHSAYTLMGFRELKSEVFQKKGITAGDLFAVVDIVNAAKPAKGTSSWSQKLSLSDPTSEVTCNFFTSSAELLPNAQENDIIIVRRIRLQIFAGNLQFVSTNSDFVLLDYESLDQKRPDKKVVLEPDEIEIVKALQAWILKRNTIYEQGSYLASALRRTIKSTITTDQILSCTADFFNYIGMVVGYFPEQHKKNPAMPTVIKVTDFTINPLPYTPKEDTNDVGDIGGIESQYILQVAVFDRHADSCPKLKFGDYVSLDNLKRNYKQPEVLETRLHYTLHDGQKIKVLDKADPLLSDLLKRKAAYYRDKLSNDEPMLEIETCFVRTRVMNPSSPISIKELLQKKECGTYQIQASVKSYQPKDIKKWLRTWCSSCQKTFDSEIEVCQNCQQKLAPIYQFAFLLEDEAEHKLIVFGFEKNADTLFDGLSAKKLYDDPSLFKDLEECIKAVIDNKKRNFFHISIESYDVPDSGRNYRITDTQFIVEKDV